MEKNCKQDAQNAAQYQADPDLAKLAEIYAEALIGACDAQSVSTDAVLEEFDSFVEQVCDAFPKFEEILVSEGTPVEEKYRIFNEVCVGKNALFCNFLKTLAKRGRLGIIRLIQDACRRLDEKRKGCVSIRVLTAVPLDAATEGNLRASLRKLIGAEPKFSVEIDPKMIGGIIVRVGDVVYDASIATQLKKARQEMIDRSAHEIQSRRDCFRNSEGN